VVILKEVAFRACLRETRFVDEKCKGSVAQVPRQSANGSVGAARCKELELEEGDRPEGSF